MPRGRPPAAHHASGGPDENRPRPDARGVGAWAGSGRNRVTPEGEDRSRGGARSRARAATLLPTPDRRTRSDRGTTLGRSRPRRTTLASSGSSDSILRRIGELDVALAAERLGDPFAWRERHVTAVLEQERAASPRRRPPSRSIAFGQASGGQAHPPARPDEPRPHDPARSPGRCWAWLRSNGIAVTRRFGSLWSSGAAFAGESDAPLCRASLNAEAHTGPSRSLSR